MSNRAMAWIVATLLTGLATSASADDALKKKVGTDAGNESLFWTMIRENVRFEASVGVWYGFLSAGLTTLTSDLSPGESGLDKAIDSIGTGEGLIREVGFGLDVFGNEAFFSYLSDKLFEFAEDEVRDRVGNKVAEEAILLIVGELRPDLGDLLGEDAKVWLRSEYGDFEGGIADSHRFPTRDGSPWFAPRRPRWETEYFSVEAGVFPDGRGKLSEFDPKWRKRVYMPDQGDEGLGVYLKYTNFSRPVVLGFGDTETGSDFMLQDGELSVYGVGVRYELLTCDTLCWRLSASLIPFTGLSSLDLGRFGTDRGLILSGGGELTVSWPIDVLGLFAFSPYASFRADWLMPFSTTNLDPSSAAELDEVQVWPVDYVLWGPTAGLTGKF